MQNMWISVVLIVLVIVLGLVAGARLSTPGPQRRAIYSAFGALAVLAIWFFVFIAFLPGDWIVPFFTVACIVFPICIYVAVSRSSRHASAKMMKIPKAKSVDTLKAEQPQGPKPPTPEQAATKAGKPASSAAATAQPGKAAPLSAAQASKPSRPAASAANATPSKPASPAPKPTSPQPASTSAPTSSKPAAPAQQKPADQAKPTEKGPKAPVAPAPQKQAEPAAAQAPHEAPKQNVKDQTAKPSAPEVAREEALAAAEHPLKQFSETPAAPAKPTAAAPSATSASAADLDLLVNKAVTEEIDELEELIHPFGTPEKASVDQGPELNLGSPRDAAETTTEAPSGSASVTAPAEDRASSPVSAATPAPAPAPAKPAKKAEPADPYAEFCKKATTLRDQGSYAVAALLFEKAAAIAPSANAKRDTQFDELSCYVKAGDSKKAKALAATLRQSSVLTRFERIKLDAVERMS